MHQAICYEPIQIPNGQVNITCSFGGSVLLRDKPITAVQFLDQADKALYNAKNAGRIVSNSMSLCRRDDAAQSLSVNAKSLVPYRQCSACRNFRLPLLLMRSIVDTAICAKPLARWTYGDWMPPGES